MKRQFIVEVAVEVETLTSANWEKHLEFLKVQVSAKDKLNATLEAVKFYQDKANVELVLDKDIVSSSIWSIVKCELVRGA